MTQLISVGFSEQLKPELENRKNFKIRILTYNQINDFVKLKLRNLFNYNV